MSACKVIIIVISALGILSTVIATFAPGWFMSNAYGERVGIGLFAVCDNGQCATYPGNITIYFIFMIAACVLQVIGIVLCLSGQVKKNRTQLKIAGGVQIMGGLACFVATVLFTIKSAAALDSISSLLHYGYSYGLAWVGGVLAIAAAVANIYTAQQNMDSLPSHIPLY